MILVDRSSPQHKIQDLLNSSDDLIDEMNHLEKLYRSSFQITPGRLNVIRDASTLIALVINILILIYYKYDDVE